MSTYQQIFKMFPKEVEDIIHEYNADHRELMQPVLLSLLSRRHICMGCCEPINKNKYLDIGFDFCSVSCYNVVDAERPNAYYHPYIEVLMYGNEVYDSDYMTHMRYY